MRHEGQRCNTLRYASILLRRCEVVAVTAQAVEIAIQIGERYQCNHWDAFYSEDLQGGQVFEGRLTVRSPF